MRINLVLCFAAFVFAALPAWAGEGGCPDYVEPQLTLQPAYEKPTYDLSLSSRELLALREKQAHRKSSEIPAGLTVFSHQMHSSFEVRVTQVPGGVCAQISKLALTVSVAETVVYIASEIPRGTCSFYEVLGHEMRHVDYSQVHLTHALPLTRSYLVDFLHHTGVIRARTDVEAQQTLKTLVGNYTTELHNSLTGVSRDVEALIDTPEEYSRLGTVCDGEVVRLMRGAVP